MPAARRRRVHVETGSQRGFQSRLTFIDGDTVFRTYVDAIKSSTAAQYLLSAVNVHNGEIAAKCPRHAGGAHNSAYSELLDALDCREWKPAVHGKVIAAGELLGDHQRIRLCQKDERVVHDRLIRILQVVITKVAIAGHIDSKNQDAALPWNVCVHCGLDHRDGNSDLSYRLHSFQHGFFKAEFT